MKLNLFERMLMLNPVRSIAQRYFESRQLFSMGGPMDGGRALEIGCGGGSGAGIITGLFGADRVDAFDLDPDMVRFARHDKRQRSHPISFWVANTRAIPVGDEQYDAVFTFGALHHVVDWRSALEEVYRVLKPGGRFYVEEILKRYITHPFWGRLMDHPQTDRFDFRDFQQALSAAGFSVLKSRSFLDLFGWYIADRPHAVSR